ncbi:MAG: 50S ribosomal protein L17 [Planctomycetaceae bacterium]|nr:50S ribosomal protein L17 [Planctomycetaceae bacterium]
MRHRVKGRKLGRNASHRHAMYRNMASSLIRTVRVDDKDPDRPKVAGRIVTTVPKAKELRPYVERLVTMARKAAVHQEAAEEFATSAERNSTEWKQWRTSDRWQKWNQAIAPAVALRRRAFALLRDKEALDILFDELAERFQDRPGGYTRVVRLAQRRLGDAGEQALIEFVGERDRVRRKREAPVVVDKAPANEAESKPSSEAPADEESDTPVATAETDESIGDGAESVKDN